MTRDSFRDRLDTILKDIIGEFQIPESELEGVREAQERLIKTLFK